MAPKRAATAKAPVAKKATPTPKAKAATKAEDKPKVDAKAKAEAKPATPKKGRGRPKKVVASVKSPAKSPAKPPKSPAKPAKSPVKPAKSPVKKPSAKKPAAKKAKVTKEAKTRTGGLKAGDMLPTLGELESDESILGEIKTIDVNAVAEESGVILFFYPKANTGGCTKQACGFSDNFAKLELAGYKIFGMSADKPGSQASWKKKYSFKYNLLSDPSYQALKKLGVAKGASGIHRSHIVVEKGGKILDIRVGISPGDSVTEAVATATEN